MAAAGGNVESALPKIIKAGHKELKLMYFFTAGETEGLLYSIGLWFRCLKLWSSVRCWTISQGTLAPQAAGAIHSDMEKGFIKAEVASFDVGPSDGTRRHLISDCFMYRILRNYPGGREVGWPRLKQPGSIARKASPTLSKTVTLFTSSLTVRQACVSYCIF